MYKFDSWDLSLNDVPVNYSCIRAKDDGTRDAPSRTSEETYGRWSKYPANPGRVSLSFGCPWVRPAPTGCPTYRTLVRLVQFHSFSVGKAWPLFQVKSDVSGVAPQLGNSSGVAYTILLQGAKQRRTGPPFVLDSTRLEYNPCKA